MNTKRAIQASVYRLFRHRRIEELLRVARGAAPTGLRKAIMYLLPQPWAYDRSVRRRARRHGLSWHLEPVEYCQWHHYFGIPDTNLQAFLTVSEGANVILDVGANVGLYSLPVAAANPRAKVVSIEAHPSTFARFSEHLAMNTRVKNIIPVQRAIGANVGVLKLFHGTDSDSGLVSAVAPNRTGAGTEVPMTTLDLLCEELALSRVDTMKIDVEGYEPEVLLGARKILSEHRPTICIELTPRWSRRPALPEAFELLRQCDYEAFGVPFADGESRLKPIRLDRTEVETFGQHNLLLVSKDRADATRSRVESALHRMWELE